MIDVEAERQYHSGGYVVVRGLFSHEEVVLYREHFAELLKKRQFSENLEPARIDDGDPLRKYPRMIHMHRWDRLSRNWLLDNRLREVLVALLGQEPYAVQTMYYFKPPGARGQALHQDQRFLQVQPGTCIAAWMAVDPCDEENGCLQVVPGTQNLPVLCTVQADVSESFTDITVPLPEGLRPVPVRMEPGDVLFFNGQLIHGSFPNRSSDRFRRALIGHYIVAEAERVAEFYHPVLGMDGSQVQLGASTEGGPCGVWVDRGGQPVVELHSPTPED